MKITKRLFFILLLIFVVSLVFNLIFLLKQYRFISLKKNNRIEATVIRVIDGDTVDVSNGERLRFYEIDAPEYPKGCLGVDAKTRMENLVLNKKVQYEKIGKDNFGRILAYVFDSRLLVNEVMVEEGLAYFIKGKVQTQNSLLIEQSQDKAKLSERGVWSSFCQTKKEGCDIKGNYRSADNTRIYHTPNCYNYDRITIKLGTSDRWFCNEEEAKKAGFRKSNDCPK
ncbi:Thermonuclease [Candidatus Roizmanbacteria bacterium]|nr:Thermonuclease [Candidatus Roizmanbacteria bacterium]